MLVVIIIHVGNGLSLYDLGQTGGSQAITLLTSQMPQHTHTMQADPGPGGVTLPGSNSLARSPTTSVYSSTTAPANEAMNPQSVSVVGGSQAHDNMQPYLVLNYIIALQGIYPARP
jgi:microcystin-dependent protein